MPYLGDDITSGGNIAGDGGDTAPPAGIVEQATGAPTWLLKGTLWLVGAGLLLRALEPAAHAVRRVATADDRKRRRS